MSSLCFEPDVFCQIEARVPDFETVYISTAIPLFKGGGGSLYVKSLHESSLD
jgi:hypothetical protein